jgi:alkanesulfonate monooxygenase SsuD/methylene tetrahydromethanopterin reductase-like flavin-dependent oxidoreductase (luciferase family)
VEKRRSGVLSAEPAHDVRYDMADETVDLVGRLWTSWEADAVEADPTGAYVDPAKVHSVDSRVAGSAGGDR